MPASDYLPTQPHALPRVPSDASVIASDELRLTHYPTNTYLPIYSTVLTHILCTDRCPVHTAPNYHYYYSPFCFRATNNPERSSCPS